MCRVPPTARTQNSICDYLVPGQLCALLVRRDGSRASVLGCHQAPLPDKRPWVSASPSTLLPTWCGPGGRALHGLPAAAVPEALSKLRHLSVLWFLLHSHLSTLLTPVPAVKADKSKQGLGFLTIVLKENDGSCLFLPP